MSLSRVAACLSLLVLSQPSVFSQTSPADLIPKSAPLAASLSISGDDEGMTWLVKRLQTYLLSRYAGDEKIDDFTFLDVSKLAFGVLPQKSGPYAFILAARLVDKGEPMQIKMGKETFTLNIRDKEAARTFKRQVLKQLLELLVEKSSESSEKVASPRGDIELAITVSSYAFLGDTVVVGSSPEAVAAARAASESKDARLSSIPSYGDMNERLSTFSSDLSLFVDNRGDNFKKYIALCRATWGQALLGMAESVDYLGLAADIVDSNSMRARIVTHSPDKARAKATLASAEAKLPLFLQQYLGGEIEHRLSMENDGLYVNIDVHVDGLSGYWNKLFEVREKESDGR